MTDLWALTASASELDVTGRGGLADQMNDWLQADHEGVPVVTCHRAELYGIGTPPGLAATVLTGADAASHLLRVATGLESAIVGEDEVLHQVRDALHRAKQSRPIDARLQRLFETAIAAGRRARSKRTESSGNLAQSAAAWLQTKSDLAGSMVLVAGAGRMGAALAHALSSAGAMITVASRDQSRASRLARIYLGQGVNLLAGANLASQASGIAVALGGPWSELSAIGDRDLPPVADISAPQAIPGRVRERLNGSFLGIDDLYRRSSPLPGAYIKDAEALVGMMTEQFMAWFARKAR